MSQTLADFLNRAGVKMAGATPAKPAKPTAKTAGDNANGPGATPTPPGAEENSQPSTEPNGGKEPRVKNTEAEHQDTGASGGDTAAAATPAKEAEAKFAAFASAAERAPEQLWLAQRGVFVEDAKIASHLYAQQVKVAEQAKQAELTKMAEEERARGAIFYQGMVKESTAMRAAFGQADMADIEKIAAVLHISPSVIVKRAEELAAAVPQHTITGDHLGTAARVDSSRAMQGAETNANTSDYRPEATEGTRQPVSTSNDPKLMRMTDVWSLPGNPGVNHSQEVDQGKGLGQ